MNIIQKCTNKLKKDWKFFLILFISIIAIIAMAFYALGVSDKLYNANEKIETDKYVENINVGTIIEQKIIGDKNNFERVDIDFEPFKDEYGNFCNITIGMKDETGNVIKEENISRNYIRENSTYEFKFKKQKNSEGKEYTLYIKYEPESGTEVNKFFSVKYKANENLASNPENANIEVENSTNINQESFWVNGQQVKGTLGVQEYYLNNSKLIFSVIAVIILVVYAIFISIYLRYKKDIKVEKIFLYTVPVICLFYIIAMPTFKNHDELYHWYRSYEVSIGKFMEGIDGDTLGTIMPESVGKAATDDWQSITYGKVKENLGLELEKENTALLYSETSAVYSFIQYIPQAVGIFITRLFTDKVLLLAYGGRIMNMIFSILLIYWAIKKIPFGKKILLGLSFIPIAIEGFSSLSPDAMTISMAFFYIAYILSLAFNKENHIIYGKKIAILTILSVIMAMCKIVYLPLILLLFIIPKEKFKNEKKIKNIIFIGAIAVVLNLIWLMIAGIYLSHFREGDSAVQVISILTHPIKYLQNCLYTLNLNGQDYIYSMFGGELGWGELVQLNSIVPYALALICIWITITDQTIKDKFKLYQKVWISLTIIAVIGLIFTSLYVQWTTIGSDSILGIQGRYFIPILPLIALLVGSQLKVKTDYSEENTCKTIATIGVVLQIWAILAIVICHL